MNPERGEVVLKAGEKEYKLRLSWNALCALEAEFNAPTDEIIGRLEDGLRARELRAVVRVALQAGEGKRFKPDEVGNIIDEAGIVEATGALMRAVTAAFPEALTEKKVEKAFKEAGELAAAEEGEQGN